MRVAKSYLAGTGATAALVAAGLVSLLFLAALLSFNGLPGGPRPSEDGGSVFVGPATSAPEAAAAAAAGTPSAVAATRVAVDGAGGADAAGATGSGGGGVPGGTVPGGTVPGEGPGTAPGVTPPPPGTAPPPASPTAPTHTSGPLSNTVQTLDDTTEGATGVDVPLSETTGPVTGKLDKTVNDTVGGVLGN